MSSTKKMFNIVFVLLFFEIFIIINVQCGQPVIRRTANGPIEGIEQISVLNQRYYSFRGIPYAEPPITGIDPFSGETVDRRFKAPEALKRNWTVPLKAHDYGKSCIPSDYLDLPFKSLLSEDCLFLNIFVPVGGSTEKTVLLFIHGGGFRYGNGTDYTCGPDFLLSQDNIVVTFGYRLGIFGFLNLGHGDYTGNMGLKDQQLAIKWIHENIEQFSGKKDEILLFGQSSGAASVQLHTLNEESRKYFNRAFSISGSALQYYVLRRSNHIRHIQNCSQVNASDEIINYLRTTQTKILSNCCIDGNCPGEDPYPIWVPNIESPKTIGAFLSQKPEDIYNSEKAPVMDSLFGFASQEGIQISKELLNKTEPLLDVDWRIKTNFPKEYERAVDKLREAYFPNTTNVDAIKRANIALTSDKNLVYSIIKTIALQAKTNNRDTVKSRNKNTFLFRFSINADLNLIQILYRTRYNGATHMDELCYMFHCRSFDSFDSMNLYEKPLERKDINYDIIMRFIKMITNFARTGDPSIEGDTPFKSCRSSNEIFCQEVSNEPKTRVINDIKEQSHYDVWREIEQVVFQKDRSSGNRASRLCQGISSTFIILFVFVLLNNKLYIH